jgi:dipeptidyl aminopeptidase/acylaminoacyl peptidase
MYRYLTAATLLVLTACSESQAPFESSSITGSPISEARGSTLVGRIAFSGYRNGELGDIYVMNPDGTGTTQLTSTADDDRSPSWSYDNQRIAFIRPRPDAANVPHYDVFVIDATGSNGHWVLPTPTSEDLYDPTWSPDGSRLVVWTVDYKVGLIDVATGAITFLQHDQDDFLGENPSFDPTGQKIVSGFGPKLRIINADGTGTPVRDTDLERHSGSSPSVFARWPENHLLPLQPEYESARFVFGGGERRRSLAIEWSRRSRHQAHLVSGWKTDRVWVLPLRSV